MIWRAYVKFRRFRRRWCKLFHASLMHPVNNRVQCGRCLETFPVRWN